MYAALKTAGTQPVESERLNSSVKKGARTSMTDFSVGVGSGSRAQLLSGSTRTTATTSSMVTGSKQVKWTSGRLFMKDQTKNYTDIYVVHQVDKIFRCRASLEPPPVLDYVINVPSGFPEASEDSFICSLLPVVATLFCSFMYFYIVRLSLL